MIRLTLFSWVLIAGLSVGSFLNVVIWRVPRGESVVRPPSHCPVCDHAIRARDNVPLISWALLGGRCRDCRSPISARYPAVELSTALLFLAVALRIGFRLALVGYLVFAAVAVAQTMIDLDCHRLPFAVTNVAYLAGLALFALASWWEPVRALETALTGMALLYGFYWMLRFIHPRAMGLGDVHLAGALGLYLGWLGWSTLFVGLFLGFLLGGVVGIVLILSGRAGRKSAIPFGPFMLSGALLAIFFGSWLGHAYLSTVNG